MTVERDSLQTILAIGLRVVSSLVRMVVEIGTMSQLSTLRLSATKTPIRSIQRTTVPTRTTISNTPTGFTISTSLVVFLTEQRHSSTPTQSTNEGTSVKGH